MPKRGFGFVTWLRCPWWPAPCPGIRDAGSASRGTSGEATLCAKFGNFQNFARTLLQPIASPEPWMIHRSHNLDFYLVSLGEALKFSPLWNSADKKILIRFGDNFSIFGWFWLKFDALWEFFPPIWSEIFSKFFLQCFPDSPLATLLQPTTLQPLKRWSVKTSSTCTVWVMSLRVAQIERLSSWQMQTQIQIQIQIIQE